MLCLVGTVFFFSSYLCFLCPYYVHLLPSSVSPSLSSFLHLYFLLSLILPPSVFPSLSHPSFHVYFLLSHPSSICISFSLILPSFVFPSLSSFHHLYFLLSLSSFRHLYSQFLSFLHLSLIHPSSVCLSHFLLYLHLTACLHCPSYSMETISKSFKKFSQKKGQSKRPTKQPVLPSNRSQKPRRM